MMTSQEAEIATTRGGEGIVCTRIVILFRFSPLLVLSEELVQVGSKHGGGRRHDNIKRPSPALSG